VSFIEGVSTYHGVYSFVFVVQNHRHLFLIGGSSNRWSKKTQENGYMHKLMLRTGFPFSSKRDPNEETKKICQNGNLIINYFSSSLLCMIDPSSHKKGNWGSILRLIKGLSRQPLGPTRWITRWWPRTGAFWYNITVLVQYPYTNSFMFPIKTEVLKQ
jgi:hypothetical protein